MVAVTASRRVPAESSSLLPVSTRANEMSGERDEQPGPDRDPARPVAAVGLARSGAKVSLAIGHAETPSVAPRGASCSATERCSWAFT